MKYMVRAKVYRASNVTFNPETMEAYSYAWWLFVKRIGQLNVFNSYRYSSATSGHQAGVRRLLGELGIQIHADIKAGVGLQSQAWAQKAIEGYKQDITDTEQAMAKGKPAKNIERAQYIVELRAKIKQVKALAKMDGVPA